MGGKIEGRIEVTGRRGRKRKQPLDDYKEKRGYWKLKETALDYTVWESCFGKLWTQDALRNECTRTVMMELLSN